MINGGAIRGIYHGCNESLNVESVDMDLTEDRWKERAYISDKMQLTDLRLRWK